MMSELEVIEEDVSEVIDRCPSVKNLEGDSILITGANGMLASYMAHTVLWLNRHFFSKPCNVYLLGRSEERLKKKFDYAGNVDYLHFLIQDVIEPLSKSCKELGYIVHAASPASPRAYSSDPISTIRCNTLATDRLLDLAYRKKVKGFLFFSSAAVYGETGDDNIPTPETFKGRVDTLGKRSCYAESKRLGETFCYNYWVHYGVPVKIVRPSHTYGIGMDLNDGRVFSDFIGNGLKGKTIKVKSDGQTRRTFCYIADANTAFWKVLLEGNPGEAYNAGNDKTETSILQFAEAVSKLFNVNIEHSSHGRIVVSKNSSCVVQRRLLDMSKIRKLGFQPLYDVSAGLKRLLIARPPSSKA